MLRLPENNLLEKLGIFKTVAYNKRYNKKLFSKLFYGRILQDIIYRCYNCEQPWQKK